jgi:hypothetical protein
MCYAFFFAHHIAVHQIATARSIERCLSLYLSYMPLAIDNHNNNQQDVYILLLIDVCFIMISLKKKEQNRHAKS